MVRISKPIKRKGWMDPGKQAGGIAMFVICIVLLLWSWGQTFDSVQLDTSSLGNVVADKVESIASSSAQRQGEGDAQKPKSDREPQMHVVFSTSCSYSHDWQAYVFFFHAYLHKQPGKVTRIVSGCSPEQEVELSKLHKERISPMNENFLIHFTPEFGKVEGMSWETTKYWNKPFGIKHFLETKYGYRYGEVMSTPYDDDVIVLVDPDMLMQRPFINDFSSFPNTMWHPSIRDATDLYHKVTHGHPIAQTYSFGEAWLRAARQGDMTEIVGPESPALQVSKHDAEVTFSAGPPYLLTAQDMYQLAYHWAKFLPGIQKSFNGMMAEMYGYCTAAAHLNLRHQIAVGLMVSNVDMSTGEGWDFLADAPDDVCDVSQFSELVPHVIHFCQRYSIGDYFISKYKVPNDFLSCDHQLYELPPLDIAATTSYSHYGDLSYKNWTGPSKKRNVDRHTFMVCSILPSLNKAGTFYKDHHCPNGANYNATWHHFRENEKQKCTTQVGCPV